MSYIDWSSIMGEIDMDFLKPLLDEVSDIYRDQWDESRESLISKDPYGSSSLEKNLADEYSGYAGQAAKEKTAILSDYYKNFANSKYESAMEEMQKQYEDLQSQFDDYKDDMTEERKKWNEWAEDHYFSNYKKDNGNNTHVTVPNKNNKNNNNNNNSDSSVWPPGGTIINPSVITNYHPFDDPSPWGGTGNNNNNYNNYYSPSPYNNTSPSYSEVPWWDYGTDYEEPAYAEEPWWDTSMSGQRRMSSGKTPTASRKITSINAGYSPPSGMITGAPPAQSSFYNKPGYTARGTVPSRQMSRGAQNSQKIQKPVIGNNKRVTPSPGFRQSIRRRY